MDTRTDSHVELRRRLADDPHRPIYHFLAPANWMNDPNGPLLYRGRYHLFYQHNPAKPSWGDIHWGHAVSDDLVHWRDCPPALAPTPEGPDSGGCFSGSAIVHDDRPALVYTGVRPETVCLAWAEDPDDPDLAQWTKHDANPIVARPPDHLKLTGWRDPCVFAEGDGYTMLIGAGHGGHWATALRYRSTDLVNWEFTHSFNTDTSCRMWECPQLLPLNGPTIDEASRHLLVVSRILSGPGPENDVVWQQGSYDKGRFTAFSLGHLDYGRVYYAPNGLIDAAGRLLLWGWIPEDRPRAQYKAAGWAGALTLPRVILRRRDGRLGMAPVGELQVLRSNHQHVTDIEIEPDGRDYVSSVRGDALELQAEFDARDAREFGLVLRASPDRAEQTLVLINQERGTVGIDTTRASEDPDVLGRIATGAFVPDDPARVHIHAFVDRSIVEVYVDGRAAVTARTYPSRAESIEVDARTRGSNALLRALHVWTMGSIWPGDEATPEDSPTNGKE